MADTAVDTTATAEVTAKVRSIQFYFGKTRFKRLR